LSAIPSRGDPIAIHDLFAILSERRDPGGPPPKTHAPLSIFYFLAMHSLTETIRSSARIAKWVLRSSFSVVRRPD
jgi:hypothetical protein